MYVCHCCRVTDTLIRAEIEAGAQDEDELARLCKAGSRCGRCRPYLARLLAEHGELVPNRLHERLEVIKCDREA
jgi:bacterioferritin-associated ferredoxin